MKMQTSNFIRKDTPTQVFSCEFYQNFKNTYFEEICERLLFTVRLSIKMAVRNLRKTTGGLIIKLELQQKSEVAIRGILHKKVFLKI